MFHVGQLVVCVYDGEPTWPAPSVNGWDGRGRDGLKRGVIYTIRDCGYLDYRVSYQLVRLVEIIRGPNAINIETGFRVDRFRPVDTNRIAIFRKMLAPAPRKEEVA